MADPIDTPGTLEFWQELARRYKEECDRLNPLVAQLRQVVELLNAKTATQAAILRGVADLLLPICNAVAADKATAAAQALADAGKLI